LLDLITSDFNRNKGQGWNISKMHELTHITRLIDMFGSPANYDTGPCERMHKEVAKKPGRAAQKRHETFTLQSATRLAERCVIDLAHSHLVPQELTTAAPQNNFSHPNGSSFIIQTQTVTTATGSMILEVSLKGVGSLVDASLADCLYPDLVEFIVAHFQRCYKFVPSSVPCRSEHVDVDGVTYRAHHSFRSNGFWHDYAWVSYVKDTTVDGFANVPAKILCFLPNGIPGDGECHVVVHACKWGSRNVTSLVAGWTLESCDAAPTNRIPYDIVKFSSLCGHCFALPDIGNDGHIHVVTDSTQWHSVFI
jgi:hypothetical protein